MAPTCTSSREDSWRAPRQSWKGEAFSKPLAMNYFKKIKTGNHEPVVCPYSQNVVILWGSHSLHSSSATPVRLGNVQRPRLQMIGNYPSISIISLIPFHPGFVEVDIGRSLTTFRYSRQIPPPPPQEYLLLETPYSGGLDSSVRSPRNNWVTSTLNKYQ